MTASKHTTHLTAAATTTTACPHLQLGELQEMAGPVRLGEELARVGQLEAIAHARRKLHTLYNCNICQQETSCMQ